MTDRADAYEGGCSCGDLRYHVTSAPMIVHCCHCRGCQRQTGTAFALNALIEADRVEVTAGAVEDIAMVTSSGNGQVISRCPACKIAVWSSYHMGGLRERIRFVRVGTLDNPDLMPPDVHIFTAAKQSWVVLPPDYPAVEVYYDYEATWSAASLERRAALFEAAGIGIPQVSIYE